MKKTFLIIFILCRALLIFGQNGFESIGLTVGGNFYYSSNIDKTLDFKPKLGTEFGFYVSIKCGKKLRYQSNLVLNNRMLTQKTLGLIVAPDQSSVIVLDSRMEGNYVHISSPNFIAYQLSNKRPLDLLLGIEPSFQLSKRFKSELIGRFALPSRNLSILGSIGTQVRFKHFFIALKYSHNIYNQLKLQQQNFGINELAALNQGIQLNVGIPLLKKGDSIVN